MWNPSASCWPTWCLAIVAFALGLAVCVGAAEWGAHTIGTLSQPPRISFRAPGSPLALSGHQPWPKAHLWARRHGRLGRAHVRSCARAMGQHFVRNFWCSFKIRHTALAPRAVSKIARGRGTKNLVSRLGQEKYGLPDISPLAKPEI